MPSGTGYMVIVEVLSPDSKLLASGCNVVSQVQSGSNSALVVQATPFATVPTCDPLITN
jgi:hypothetical protein